MGWWEPVTIVAPKDTKTGAPPDMNQISPTHTSWVVLMAMDDRHDMVINDHRFGLISGTRTTARDDHRAFYVLCIMKHMERYDNLSNDSFSGGSVEDSLAFFRVDVLFTRKDMSRGRAIKFLELVEEPNEWHTVQVNSDGVSKLWKIMETSEFEMFKTWVDMPTVPLGFTVVFEHREL